MFPRPIFLNKTSRQLTRSPSGGKLPRRTCCKSARTPRPLASQDAWGSRLKKFAKKNEKTSK